MNRQARQDPRRVALSSGFSIQAIRALQSQSGGPLTRLDIPASLGFIVYNLTVPGDNGRSAAQIGIRASGVTCCRYQGSRLLLPVG